MSNPLAWPLLAGALWATAAAAQDTDTTDQDADMARNASVSGILIGTYQLASESEVNGQDVEDEANAQLYLFGELDMGPGTWFMEVRGGTTPQEDGVTSFFGEVNDTVGETLDEDGEGRFAVTQLYYGLTVGRGELSLGLLDSSANLDTNPIADDEYTQFLGSSFVNNPSIEYPSFALGAVYAGELSGNLGYTVLASSTGGLEDSADPSYDNVFDVDEDGKGAFLAGELRWNTASLDGNVGIWYNGADHSDLDDPFPSADDDEKNYGVYTSVGGDIGPGRWVGWGGLANEEVSAVANFLGLAYSQGIGAHMTLGLGVARIGASDDVPEPADSVVQAEAYLRIQVLEHLYLTPDLQYVANSGFDPDRDTFVFGLRAGMPF